MQIIVTLLFIKKTCLLMFMFIKTKMNVTMERIFLMERRTRAFYCVEFSLLMGKHFEFLCTPEKNITQGRISVMGGNLYIPRSRKNVEP